MWVEVIGVGHWPGKGSAEKGRIVGNSVKRNRP